MSFRPFGLDHWGVLIFTLAVGLGLVLNAKGIRKIHDDRLIRYPLALALLLNEIGSWIYYYVNRGIFILPLQLCDLAFFLIVWSLLIHHRYVTELAFFLGLGASSQAILTPDISDPFPSFLWVSFFASHSGIVLSAVYLLVRGYANVTIHSVWRAWLFTNLYAAAVGFVNWRLGTNFGYLARKPFQPSLLDYLGPWPYYILWCELIALGIYFLCYLFAGAVERVASKS